VLAGTAISGVSAAQEETVSLPSLHQQTVVRAPESGLLVIGIPDEPLENGVQLGDIVTSAGDIPAPIELPAFMQLATEAHARGESVVTVAIAGVAEPRKVAIGGTRLIPVAKDVPTALCDVPSLVEKMQVPPPSARITETWFRFVINNEHVGCERHHYVYGQDTLVHRAWVAFDLGEQRGGKQLMYCRTNLAMPDFRLISSEYHIPDARWKSTVASIGDPEHYRIKFFENGVEAPPDLAVMAPSHGAYPDYFLAQAPMFLGGAVGGGFVAHPITSDRVSPLASVVALAEEECAVNGLVQMCVRYDTRAQAHVLRRSWRAKSGRIIKNDYGNGAISEGVEAAAATAGLAQELMDFVNGYDK